MAYTVIHEDREQVRRLLGPRPFAELLTRAELEQVERGELVGVSVRGDVLALSSPLEDGATVTLRAPDPARDLALLGVPANERGELVGIPEALRIRQYELEHGVDLWQQSLAEIRRQIGPPPSKVGRTRAFFGDVSGTRLAALGRLLRVDSNSTPQRRRLVPLAGKAA